MNEQVGLDVLLKDAYVRLWPLGFEPKVSALGFGREGVPYHFRGLRVRGVSDNGGL